MSGDQLHIPHTPSQRGQVNLSTNFVEELTLTVDSVFTYFTKHKISETLLKANIYLQQW
jgi:hypothetical protein